MDLIRAKCRRDGMIRGTLLPLRSGKNERGAGENAPEAGLPVPDPAEAAICLECRRKRCLLDEGKGCARYGKALRTIRGSAGRERPDIKQ